MTEDEISFVVSITCLSGFDFDAYRPLIQRSFHVPSITAGRIDPTPDTDPRSSRRPGRPRQAAPRARGRRSVGKGAFARRPGVTLRADSQAKRRFHRAPPHSWARYGLALAVFDGRIEGVGVDAHAVAGERLHQGGSGGRGAQQADAQAAPEDA